MPTQTEWNARYVEENTPWDLGKPSKVLQSALNLGLLEGRQRVLVPGCGRGHDVLELAKRGHDAVGADFAEQAIAWLNEQAAERELSAEGRVIDIFSLEDAPVGTFDAVWEYTCFVAIDPSLRDRYAALMTRLVRPGGRFVHAVFPTHREPDAHNPPWPILPDEVKERFGKQWKVVLETAPTVTPKKRRGREVLLILERLADEPTR
ncbi:MAG: SAM-dependent methyltransferase [Bradymonadia bacterium]|jgi:SAM-dependent methyltransferase